MPRMRNGFISRPLSVAEAVGEEPRVHVLDDGVQAEVLLVVLAGHGERDLGERGARRGHAGGAEDGRTPAPRVPSTGRAAWRAAGRAVSPWKLLVAELVERDLQRPLQAAGGDEVGDVAGVADADLLERLAVRGEAALPPRGTRCRRGSSRCRASCRPSFLRAAAVARRGAEPAGAAGCIASYSAAGISR